MLLHRLETGRAEGERLLPPSVHLPGRRAPEDLVEHRVGLKTGQQRKSYWGGERTM